MAKSGGSQNLKVAQNEVKIFFHANPYFSRINMVLNISFKHSNGFHIQQRIRQNIRVCHGCLIKQLTLVLVRLQLKLSLKRLSKVVQEIINFGATQQPSQPCYVVNNLVTVT